jgi:hypothetical protein
LLLSLLALLSFFLLERCAFINNHRHHMIRLNNAQKYADYIAIRFSRKQDNETVILDVLCGVGS